jgi:dephospho-CoA kinase
VKIENNVLKHHLRNVYFVCGNACGGKTTMSKLLAKKHGFYLYDMDQQYRVHREMANKSNQPEMCYHGKDFHEQFTRPVCEQARWNMSSLREQSDMVIMDLIKLSENQIVVADVLFIKDYLDGLVDPKQIVFLTVDDTMIREIYFKRTEKKDFYDYIKSQELSEVYFENIFLALEETNRLENNLINESGYLSINRRNDSTIYQTLQMIEEHFGLSTRRIKL